MVSHVMRGTHQANAYCWKHLANVVSKTLLLLPMLMLPCSLYQPAALAAATPARCRLRSCRLRRRLWSACTSAKMLFAGFASYIIFWIFYGHKYFGKTFDKKNYFYIYHTYHTVKNCLKSAKLGKVFNTKELSY